MSFADRITRVPIAFEIEFGEEAAALFPGISQDTRDLICGTAGSSPYLRGLILKNAAWLRSAISDGPETAFSSLLAEAKSMPDPDLEVGLRDIKGKVALLVALADLGGIWVLEDVTKALTEFADLAVDKVLAACVAVEVRKGKLAETSAPAGGVVALAMGKMGAGELNYSSDIDLICLYDSGLYGEDRHSARSSLVRAVRRAAKLLSDTTENGYVFRTDLRLRPDPAVTPVVLSFDAAETYYESVGRTWERAAYIKARAAAGYIDGGKDFLNRLTPFVYRRHLDFAAIQDAHDMRLRIREHKGLFGAITLPKHDMKLGRGGIREIEFFTQTRQLIAGGRDKELRQSGTIDGLKALARKGWVPEETATTLIRAYRSHREVEHRLQMIRDAQTHALPSDDEGFARLAALMGQDKDELREQLHARLETVHALTEEFFTPTETVSAKQSGSHEFQEMMDGWLNYPALRNDRAATIFERIKPELIARLNTAAKPQEAFEQFDMFLSRLPAGVQLFSLFEANSQLIDLIVDIASTAPALAQYLGRNAQVFDAVIDGNFFAPWPGVDQLESRLTEALSSAQDYEEKLDAARRWHKEWHFRIGVHYLRGLISAQEAGRQYAELAEATVRCLWEVVVTNFSVRYGPPPGQGAAVLGMGSLGAKALSATSDLDLIVIYDAEGTEYSQGSKSLDARSYYSRLTQAFVTAFSVQTAEGALYEVDMRLRPSGRKGPVATSFKSFKIYQREEAWTWELLALTRARAIAGPEQLCEMVDKERRDIIAIARDPASVIKDVSEMRDRLADAQGAPEEHGVKRGPGRMMEIELLAQSIALLSGSGARGTLDQLDLAPPATKIDQKALETLAGTYRWYWSVQSGLRLLAGTIPGNAAIGVGGWAFLSRETGVNDASRLTDEIAQRATLCEKLITQVLDGIGGTR